MITKKKFFVSGGAKWKPWGYFLLRISRSSSAAEKLLYFTLSMGRTEWNVFFLRRRLSGSLSMVFFSGCASRKKNPSNLLSLALFFYVLIFLLLVLWLHVFGDHLMSYFSSFTFFLLCFSLRSLNRWEGPDKNFTPMFFGFLLSTREWAGDCGVEREGRKMERKQEGIWNTTRISR